MNQINDPNRFRKQVERVILRGCFIDPARPMWCARAPGRLDFMGGNVDYTGGMVLQVPTCESIWAIFQPSTEPLIRIFNPEVEQFGWATTLEMRSPELDSLAAIEELCEATPHAAWGKYVLGALHLLRLRYAGFAGSGGDLYLASDLPPNRGVASSAALEIAVLKATSSALGIPLAGVELATAGQWVENVVARSACGIMDQAAVVLGVRNSLLPILCQPCTPAAPIPLPEGMRIWGIDSMVPRSTSSEAYEAARAAALMGYKLICQRENLQLCRDVHSAIQRWMDARWNGYLSNLRPSEFRSKYERHLPESMTGREFLSQAGEHADPFTSIDPDREYPVRAAVRYAVEENVRVETVKTLLESSGHRATECALRLIGELARQSHAAYAECGLGARACDELVQLAHDFGFFGAKMTGGGGGGVVAVLGTASQQDALNELVANYRDLRGELPHVFQGSSNGAEVSGEPLAAGWLLEAVR